MKCTDTENREINVQGIDTSHGTALIVNDDQSFSIRKIKRIMIELE